MSAWGSSRLQALSPKARTARPMTQIDSGGLSMVIQPGASSAPKNMARQSVAAAWAAAA